jgi:hypothetical protein
MVQTSSQFYISQRIFAACTPLEALLESTLDCLYDIQCLQLLTDYFPDLEPVCIVVCNHSLLRCSFHLDEIKLDGLCSIFKENKSFCV